jgi:hypothetical protein
VVGIALDFRGPAFVTLDKDALSVAAQRRGGGEEERLAEHELFRLLDVRHDDFPRLASAPGHSRERERSAHQMEELAAAHRVEPLRGVLRELAV